MGFENINISLKTVVSICIYAVTIAGLYFTMNSEIENLTEKVHKFEINQEKYSPQVMEYKLNSLQSEVKDLNAKADKIYEVLNEKTH